MPKKTENLHPIFTTCVWRSGEKISVESAKEKLEKCKVCYESLKETTEFCEHMNKHFDLEKMKQI